MKTKNYLITLLLCVFSTVTAFAVIDTNSEYIYAELQEPGPTMIELLQDGESYSVEITSIGCFNGSRQTVMVSKEADVYTAHFQDSSKILTTKEIEAFILFELQLRELKLGGCTTVDTYALRYGGETFRTSDGTCSWNGGKKLLETLGYAKVI